MNYADYDLTFYFGVYKDVGRARSAIHSVRQHYPGARLLVVSDGDDDPTWQEFGAVYGERLYPLRNGGRMIHRMLSLFLGRPTQYLFKLDTDTVAHRRFHELPVKSGVFGHLQRLGDGSRTVQGGFQGFTLEAAQTLHCGLLDSEELCDHKVWAKDEWLLKYVEGRGLISTDWLLGYAADRLGVEMYEYREIWSNWKRKPAEPSRYAFVHPS